MFTKKYETGLPVPNKYPYFAFENKKNSLLCR